MDQSLGGFEQFLLDRIARVESRSHRAKVLAVLALAVGLFIVFATLAALAWKVRQTETEAPPTHPPAGALRMTAAPFFSGELKRLEPHLGLITGCLRVEYQDSPLSLHLTTEIWRDGKCEKENDGTMDMTVNEPGELTISLREIDGDREGHYRAVIALSSQSGYAASSTTIPKPKLHGSGSGLKGLSKPIELSTGESRRIWGFMAGKGAGEFRSNESLEDMVKRVEWAFIIRAKPQAR